MSSLNDLQFWALRNQGYTGALPDMMDKWMEDNESIISTYPTWFSLLGEFGGYTGALNDREYKFWSDGGSLYAFYAPLTNSLTPTVGTLAGFTTEVSDNDMTVTDFEGLVRDTKGYEARFVGARRVENLALNTLATSGGSKTVTQDGDKWTIEITGTATTNTVWNQDNTNLIVGDKVILSGKIRVLSGDLANLSTVDLLPPDYVSPAIDLLPALQSTPVGDWIYFTSDVNTLVVAVGQTSLRIGQGTAGSGYVTLEVKELQFEVVTGQANQNPSEYVSVGVGTEAELNPDVGILTEAEWDVTTYNAGTYWSWSSGSLDMSGSPIALYSHIAVSNNVNVSDVASPALREGRLYAVTYTVENYVSGHVVCIINSNITDIGTTRNANGTYTDIIRVSGAPALSGDGMGLAFTNAGTGAQSYSITNVSLKEINHGSNVDGVKYFDTINYNTVSSNIVTTDTLPTDADVQQVGDPTDFSGWVNGVGNADFLSTTAIVSGGALQFNSGAINLITGTFTPEIGKYYRIQIDINPTAAVTGDFGGASIFLLADSAKSYDVIIKATTTDSLAIYAGGAANGSTFDNIYITPLEHIPEDYLKGVLIEELSENVYPYSEDFSQTPWTLVNVTLGTGEISPRGNASATKLLTANTSSNQKRIREVITTDIAASADYVCSIYAKKEDLDYVYIATTDKQSTAIIRTFFNVSDGTLGTNNHGAGNAGIEAVGDGWYRCWVKDNAALDAGNPLNIDYGQCVTDGAITYVGVVNEGNLFWGAQAEQKSFPTSYIPTNGAAATRTATNLIYEVPQQVDKAGNTELSMFIEGSDFIDYENKGLMVLHENGTGEDLFLFRTNASSFRTLLYDWTTADTNAYNPTTVVSDFKMGLTWSFNDVEVYVNGTEYSYAGSISSLDFTGVSNGLYIGVLATGNTGYANCPLKNARIYTVKVQSSIATELTT